MESPWRQQPNQHQSDDSVGSITVMNSTLWKTIKPATLHKVHLMRFYFYFPKLCSKVVNRCKPNHKPPPKSQYIPKWKLFMELGESTWIFWHKCGNQPAQDVCSCRVSKICYDKHVTVEDGNDLPCMSGCYIRLCPTQKNTFFCPRNRETHWESYGGLSNAHGRRPTFLWGMVGIFLFHDLRRH